MYEIIHADCFEWLPRQPDNSFHAVITDSPFGIIEFTETEKAKLRNGNGGVWRIPPNIGGSQRAPLPRFTVRILQPHFVGNVILNDLWE